MRRSKRIVTALLSALLLSIVFVMAGCNSSPGWEAKLDFPPAIQTGSESALKVMVSSKEGPVTGLTVQATLEMTKMEHDFINVTFRESQNGLYETKAALPMDGAWSAVITMDKNGMQKKQTIDFQTKMSANVNVPVASINGEFITQDDLEFYVLANDVQTVLKGSGSRNSYDKNGLLTQIIRLRAVGLLAKEKGHMPDAQEVEKQSGEVRRVEEADPALQQRIMRFGPDRYRQKQMDRLTLLLLARQVQKDVEEKVKAENPQMSASEIRFQAAKAYEDLVVSQIGTLKVKVNK